MQKAIIVDIDGTIARKHPDRDICGIIILSIFFSCISCSTQQPYITKTVLPEVSPILMTPCEPPLLLTIGDMRDVATVMITNGGRAKKCRNRNLDWQQWYLQNQKLMSK